MSLPETLALGGSGTFTVVSTPMAKANYGRYVSTAMNLDAPLTIQFLHNVKNNGVLTATIKTSEFRNYVSDIAPNGGIGNNKSVQDPEMGVWITAAAPIGNISQGYFTQAQLVTRIQQLCVTLLSGDTIERFVRGEL